MKAMKKITYFISAALLIAGALTSCSLDSDSTTEKDTSSFPKSETDANQALAAIYENLNAVIAYPQESFFYVSMLASDDNLGGGGTNDKLMQSEDLILNYNQNMTEHFWKIRYEGINRANVLIEALKSVDLNATTKAQADGEAKFLRAFYYYELASQYGRVPLIVTASAPDDVTPPAASVIWGQILQDLRDAADEMPATRLTNGHVDKYCAEAMLCRAWLFYTGMYCNGETLANLVSTNYSPLTEVALPDGTTLTKEKVVSYINDCVTNSGYSLVSDFRNLWAYTNKYTVNDYSYTKDQDLKWAEDDGAVNPETMFAIKFNKLADWSTTIGYANGYSLHFGVRGGQDYASTFPFGQGWGAGPVAPNLVKDWKAAEPNDKRLNASVQDWTDGTTAYKKGGWSDFVQETDYYEKKLSPISAKDSKQASGYTCCFENLMYGSDGWIQGANNMQLNNIHDLVLIRFADVLLMQSELTGTTDGINKVRARAGLSPISGYSDEALRNERRFELAFEGTRWNDIRRWHIAAAALEKQTGVKTYYCGNPDTNTPHNGGYTDRYNATAGFFKIPENQISMLSKYLTQNDGWTDSKAEYNGWK
jgi:hypothetical protein